MIPSWLKHLVGPSEAEDTGTSGESPLLVLPNRKTMFETPTIELGQLTGKCLIASPFMSDNRFRHAVVFVCGHSDKGAMGLVINQPIDEPSFPELLEQFNIDAGADTPDITTVQGGPVENGRGFVLHGSDYNDRGTQVISPDLSMSCSLDVLKAMADNAGPAHALLALGYTGWDAGQLEAELAEHSWLVTDTDDDLLFEISCNHRWEAALGRIGVQPGAISMQVGRA